MSAFDRIRQAMPELANASDAEILSDISRTVGVPSGDVAKAFGYRQDQGMTSARIGAGVDNYQAGLYGVGEAAASAMGAPGVADWMRSGRQANQADAEAESARARDLGAVDDWRDVGGVGSGLNYLGGLAAQSLPYMAEAAVGGLAARGLMTGTRAALAGAQTAEAANSARTALNVGSTVGGTVASYPSAVGDILQNQREETPNGPVDLGSAMAGGVPYAALNAVGAEGLVARGMRPIRGVEAGLARRMGVNAGVTAFGEGASETGQEMINQGFGRMAVNPEQTLFNDDANKRYLDSFIGGAALGGVMGGAAGVRRPAEEQPDLLKRQSDTPPAPLAPAFEPASEGRPEFDLAPYGQADGPMYNQAGAPEQGAPMEPQPGQMSIMSGVSEVVSGQPVELTSDELRSGQVPFVAPDMAPELSTSLGAPEQAANGIDFEYTASENPQLQLRPTQEPAPAWATAPRPEFDLASYGQGDGPLAVQAQADSQGGEPTAIEPAWTADRNGRRNTNAQLPFSDAFKAPKAQQMWGVAQSLAVDGHLDDASLTQVNTMLADSQYGRAAKIVEAALKEKRSTDNTLALASKVMPEAVPTPEVEPSTPNEMDVYEQPKTKSAPPVQQAAEPARRATAEPAAAPTAQPAAVSPTVERRAGADAVAPAKDADAVTTPAASPAAAPEAKAEPKKPAKTRISAEDKDLIDGALDAYNSAPSSPNPTAQQVKEHFRKKVIPAIQYLQNVVADKDESAAARAYAQEVLDNEIDPKDIAEADVATSAGRFRSVSTSAGTGKSITTERATQIIKKVLDALGITNLVRIEAVRNPAEAGLVAPPDVVPSGVTTKGGVIYLFTDNIGSDVEAFRTVFHELFHLGLSKTVGQTDYIQQMLRFKADKLVREYAQRWKQSADGQDRKGKMPVNNYEALAVEEALADIGEDLSTGALGSKEQSRFVRSAVTVLASMADAVGLSKVAQAVRRMTYTEAEKFVTDTITGADFGAETSLASNRFKSAGVKDTVEAAWGGIKDSPTADYFNDLRKGWRYKPGLLGFLSLDQIVDRFPEMERVHAAVKSIQQMGARARQFMETPAELRKQWAALYRKDRVMTQRLNDLFLQSTLAEVWVDGTQADPMNDPRNAHLKSQDAEVMAKNRAEAMKAKQVWNSLSAEHKALYTSVLGELRTQFDAKQSALLKRIVDAHMDVLGSHFSADELVELGKMTDAERATAKMDLRPGMTHKVSAALTQFLSDVQATYVKPSELPGPYFPLTRKGSWVVVKKSEGYKAQEKALQDAKDAHDAVYGREVDTDGLDQYKADMAEALKALREARAALDEAKAKPDDYSVQFFESRTAAERTAKEMKLDLKTAVFARQEHFSGVDTVSAGLVNKLTNRVSSELGGEVAKDVAASVRRMLIEAMPERSAMKAELKRMKVDGANPADAMDSFSGATHKNAWTISRLENTTALAKSLSDARASTQDDERLVGNELAKRFAQQLNYTAPNAMIDMAAGLSHFSFLGLSVGYYVQNMLQPWLVTLPIMAGRFGVRASGAAISQASAEVVKAMDVARKGGAMSQLSTKLDYALFEQGNGEQELLKALTDEGLIDITIRADMGSGGTSSHSAVGHALQTVTEMASYPPHLIEVVNRVSTALAAYRMSLEHSKNDILSGSKSKEQAQAEAKAYAEKLLAQTQVDYSQENAPRFMNPNALGGMGRLAFQFKRYQQAMAFLWMKLLLDTKRGDAEARRSLVYLMGTSFATAGMAGLPIAAPAALLAMAVSKMSADDDEPDYAQLFYASMKEFGGQAFADGVRYGVPAALGVNLSGKLGYGQTYGTGLVDKLKTAKTGTDAVGATASMLFGPSGGLAANAADAVLMAADNPVKAAGLVMPKGVKDLAEAVNREFGAGLTDRKGRTLLTPDELDYTAFVAKALGLGDSTDVSRMYDARGALLDHQSGVKTVRDRLLREAVAARKSGEGADAVREQIAEFNERQPGDRIQPKHVLASYQQELARMKELRGGVRVKKKDVAAAEAYGLTSD